ncbi:MAG: 3-methyl-2-oxobutanoate hydroxymethyltransferase [Bdellovibrionaceae bacterium]|nr:3-methyl-2-oxobutanoate hydroxymethyltransferase [Pseudobdellovibrionaceae bacterium]NUM58896.1 3-methyl-2-oxobutanoate hydroxymethyltransferase [Pseudobdellovibrionaceae bacterium]
MKNKLNAFNFHEKKDRQQKISMITCYDYSFARILNESPIDCILVGDSGAMVMQGFSSTVNASMEMMELFTQAVCRGAPDKFVVGDLPFLSYRMSLTENMKNVERLMKAGAQALKLEGAAGNLELVKYIVESGVPVMGHLGLTPQSVNTLGGFKVQGKSEDSRKKITEQALNLEQAGCFSIVLECVPSDLAKSITGKLKIPTIGIGAGVETDGQVLVLQDLLGFQTEFKPKFLRHFMNGKSLFNQAFNEFHNAVVEKTYPNENEKY